MGVEILVKQMSDQQEDHNSDGSANELKAFLSRDGSIGILVRLDMEDGLINKELQDRVHVVSTTLSNRLTEATKLELIETVSDPRDHGNAKRYRLTERGDALRRQLVSHEIEDVYDEFVELHDQLKAEEEKLAAWALEEGIDDKRWPGDRDRDDDRPDT